MALWTRNKEDLVKKTSGGKSGINKTGAYEVEVKEAYITNSFSSKAQAITLAFETEENYGRVNLWFKKANGEENTFATERLNRMLFLMKIKTDEELVLKTKKVKLYSGSEIDRVFLPQLEDKKIGMLLIAALSNDGQNINLDCNDFFDVGTRKTSDELIEKRDAETVIKFEERNKDAEEIKIKKKSESTTFSTIDNTETQDDDGFPF